MSKKICISSFDIPCSIFEIRFVGFRFALHNLHGYTAAHTSILLIGLCRPYGAKTIVYHITLAQWATVVTPRWGVFVMPRLGATQ